MGNDDTSVASPGSAAEDNGDKQLGRVALKRVAVSRTDAENRRADAKRKRQNPMNRLVPYLDLFHRLADDELSRLAEVSVDVVVDLRKQVAKIKESLAQYIDLLPRLGDDELARMTGAPEQTIRLWRLCRPANERRLRKLAENGSGGVVAAKAVPERTAEIDPSASQSGAQFEGVTGEVFPGFEGGSDDELDDLEIGNWVDDDVELED